MALKDLDIGFLMQRLADKRVEDAMAEGKFDNLPGRGEPVVIDEAPTDEKARELWWALRIMRQNDFVPDEVRWRKAIDHLKAELAVTTTESRVRTLVGEINQLVGKLNTLGTNAIRVAIGGVDLDGELCRIGSGPTDAVIDR